MQRLHAARVRAYWTKGAGAAPVRGRDLVVNGSIVVQVVQVVRLSRYLAAVGPRIPIRWALNLDRRGLCNPVAIDQQTVQLQSSNCISGVCVI